jgi:hypothetical protein
MITDEARERVRGWFSGRLPADWQDAPADISIDRDEIVVILALPDVEAGESEVETEEARAGRASAFREETREQRMAIAREAQRRYERTVSWGVKLGDHVELFTHLAAPTMTRLRQPQRQVLDTLVDAGVARSRADALAWCVRLVAQHEDDWLTELRGAMSQVADVRTKGRRPDPHAPGPGTSVVVPGPRSLGSRQRQGRAACGVPGAARQVTGSDDPATGAYALGRRQSGRHGGARQVLQHRVHPPMTSGSFRDGEDGVRHEAVSLLVDAHRGVGVRGLHEAEDLPLLLVDPVPQVAHAVPLLRPQVRRVRLLDIGQADRTTHRVHIHEQGHVLLLYSTARRLSLCHHEPRAAPVCRP